MRTLLAIILAAFAQSHAPARQCAAEDAHLNLPWDAPKGGIDFVEPIPGARYYVVYSPKENYTTNVTMTVIPLAPNLVLLFGTGYGEINAWWNNHWSRSERSSAEDMALIDEVIRGCLGFGPNPEDVEVQVVAPHWHPDHVAAVAVHALRDLGYQITALTYHVDDQWDLWHVPQEMYVGMEVPQWTLADFLVADPVTGTGCNTPIRTWDTALGLLWLTHRPGHTAGSVDLVLDLFGDPAQRVWIQGSGPNAGNCIAPSGTILTQHAHGNVRF